MIRCVWRVNFQVTEEHRTAKLGLVVSIYSTAAVSIGKFRSGMVLLHKVAKEKSNYKYVHFIQFNTIIRSLLAKNNDDACRQIWLE